MTSTVLGSGLSAVGFYLLAQRLPDLSLSKQTVPILIAGGGIGLMLGPASTDAVNRAASSNYSEVTGITQTVRNFGASLGLAILGAILIDRDKTNVAKALRARGETKKRNPRPPSTRRACRRSSGRRLTIFPKAQQRTPGRSRGP